MPTQVIPKQVPVDPGTEYIGPQPGPQEMFLKSSADITGYGGSGGG